MKRARIVTMILFVVALSLLVPVSNAMSGNVSNVISPGEERAWGPIKEGDILRIYCPYEGQRLSGVFSHDQAKRGDILKHRSGSLGEFPGETLKPSVGIKIGKIIIVNIYCAKSVKGPWRWLQCTKSAYFPFVLETEKELGYTPEVYMFEIRCYQHSVPKNCKQLGWPSITTLKISALPGQIGKTDENKISPAESFAISAKKLTDIITRRKELARQPTLPSFEFKHGPKYLGEVSFDKFDNPFYVKAAVDSAKAFALSAKMVPELSDAATTTLRKTKQIDRLISIQIQRMQTEKDEVLVNNLRVLRARLAKAIEPFLRSE